MTEHINTEEPCEHASLRLERAALAYLDHPEIPQHEKEYLALLRVELTLPLIPPLCGEELYEPKQHEQSLTILQNP